MFRTSCSCLEPYGEHGGDGVFGVGVAAFGFLVALMGCYHGYQSRGGAQGVGAATTNAVVSASILILVSNYLITEVFFSR